MDIPVTVKLRTGILDNMPLAAKLIPKFQNWVFIYLYNYLLHNYLLFYIDDFNYRELNWPRFVIIDYIVI